MLSGDVTAVSVAITGATTTSATPSCTGTGTWTLNVGSWTTNGTSNVSVTQLDAAGNTGTVQQDVTVDKVAPTLTSITRTGPESVNAGPLTWTATFSEPVVGVTTNFRLTTGALGGTAPSISGVSPDGGVPSATWTVTERVAGATGANNGLGAGKALVIDTTRPMVTVSKIDVAFPFPIYPVTVSGTSEAGAGPVTVFLCYNAGPTCDAGNVTQTFSVTGATWTTGWSSQWGRGTWYASAEQTDAAGNVGTSPVFGPFTS